jgi:hypothetical protein
MIVAGITRGRERGTDASVKIVIRDFVPKMLSAAI